MCCNCGVCGVQGMGMDRDASKPKHGMQAGNINMDDRDSVSTRTSCASL